MAVEEWRYFDFTLKEIYNHLGQQCMATTLLNGKKKVYHGHLYNIDPETQTLFILQFQPITTESVADTKTDRALEQERNRGRSTSNILEQDQDLRHQEQQQQPA